MAGRSRYAWVVVVATMSVLGGCVHRTQPPQATLTRARAILAEAQRQPSSDPAVVAEARGALEYAERELRLSPQHPLNEHRAQVAVDKARAALARRLHPRMVARHAATHP